VKRLGEIGAVLCVLAALLAGPAGAAADTPFGGNPQNPVTPGVTCENAAVSFVPSWRAPTCTWYWSHLGVGSDIVPLPVTGGSATITGVTLPAMANPGTMQVVILTAALSATNEPSRPQFICCQVKTIGPSFTVPANQVATVPQNLAVSATKEANLEHPGETSFGDIAAISVLTPGASLPLRYTGKTSLNSTDGGDGDSAYFPAVTAPNGEFREPTDPAGFEMNVQFTLGTTPAPAPAPGPAPAPAVPGGATGLKLNKGADRVGADGKTVGFGTAANPPTAATTQTLTLPTGRAARASAAGKKPKKPVVLGAGKTTIAAGKTAPIALKLNGKARAILRKKHKLTATLTIVATNTAGQSETKTSQVTIKPAARKHRG
jgi:hypothetical protein